MTVFLACYFGAASHAEAAASCKKYPIVVVLFPEELREVGRLVQECAYDEALDRAEQIEKPGIRIWAYGQVAKALAEAGQVERAEAVARKFDRSFERDHVLLEIVRGYVEVTDDDPTVLRLVDMIEEPRDRAIALCYVTAGQLARDRVEDARRTLERARIEASHLTDVFAISEVSGRISALYDEFGQPGMLGELMKDLTAGGLILGPWHLVATMEAQIMRGEIEDIRSAARSKTSEQ